MSDIPTPITDRDCLWGYEVSEFNEYVDSDTCRDLERQLAHVRNVLSRILADLPHNRDWLDPALEREARDIVNS